MTWNEVVLKKAVLDAGFMAREVSDSEYMIVLSRWGYTLTSAQREIAWARERRAHGLEAGAGDGAVRRAERFIDSRCNGCGVPKQTARW